MTKATSNNITSVSPLTGESLPLPLETKGADYIEYLHPCAGGAVGEPAYYRSLYFLDTLDPEGDPLTPLTGPIDPFDEKFDKTQASLKPAFGVLTVHEQQWIQTGLELGNLLQSICLAPGEVTQVAVTRWQHRTAGTSSDEAVQSESVDNLAEQSRHVNEVQRSVANEAQWGGSSVFSSSSSAQAGGGCFFASASAATTMTSALTAQHSGGNRSIAAEATNAISQSTAEKSQSLRSRRQTVVREVTESEAEDLTTRVIANYNRRHSLNVLFFEVLQKYSVVTRLVDWDRCLFVPFVPLDFDQPDVFSRHQAQLLGLFRELGAPHMIEHLTRALDQQEAGKKAIDALTAERTLLEKAKDIASLYLTAQGQLDAWQSNIALAPTRINEYTIQRTAADAKGRRDMVRRYQAGIDKWQGILNDGSGFVEHWKLESEERRNAWDELCKDAQLPSLADATAAWDSIQSRLKDIEARIAEHRVPVGNIFNADRLFISQQLWLRMSPHRIHRILKDYKIVLSQPGSGERVERSIAALVDPKPVGVFGSYVAFRWGFDRLEEDGKWGKQDRDQFWKKFLEAEEERKSEQSAEHGITVGLPTSGVFAEAVMGQSVAAETSDSRFDKWSDHDNQIPILPPKIADLQSRKANGMDLTGRDFSAPLAQLRAGSLADVSHIDKVLGLIGKGDMFRDMGGLAQAVSLSEKLATLSEAGAKEVGDRVANLQKEVLQKVTDIINGPNGSAVLSELMVPGSGAGLLKGGKATTPPATQGDLGGKATTSGKG